MCAESSKSSDRAHAVALTNYTVALHRSIAPCSHRCAQMAAKAKLAEEKLAEALVENENLKRNLVRGPESVYEGIWALTGVEELTR